MKRDNANKLFFLIINFIFILLISPAITGQSGAEKGVLDLSKERLGNDIISLNGEWEFYWSRHLRPADFEEGAPKPDTYGAVPSYWIKYSDEIPEIENRGYATYRLKIILPEYTDRIVFDIPVFDSSFRIYIDGKLAGGNGIAGETEAETMPEYAPFTYEHIITGRTVEVIVDVTNYHHRRGGFWLPVRIGRPETIYSNISTQKAASNITTGILLAFAVFFFVFFINFRPAYSMLFFALATLGIVLRDISTGHFIIMTFFDLSWTTLIRFEYIGSFIALILGSWYFYRIFPDKYFRIITTLITVLFSLAILLVLVSPVFVFANSIRIFIPFVALILIYYGLKSILSLNKDRSTGILNTIGFVALLIGAVNDITLSGSNIFISGSYILPYATTVFIFMQVIILINRFVSSFKKEKQLLTELEYVNQNLEKIVDDRTQELSNQKSELEGQKEEIEAKNEELERTLRIKDRLFSIIAHDLKSPVVNLSMIIDNLKTSTDDAKLESVTSELSKQVDFSINLIDNLLIWGQGQQKQIEYRPGKWNMTDIVIECFNLLNSQAEMKDIQLSFSHRGSPVAWCDRHLVSIILRNLITNAIKFTPEKGKIYVLSEEVADINPYVKVSVKDTGVGIDYENLDSLRSNKIIKSTSGTRGEKGTGLGLQLCYDLIKVNKGDMEIHSAKGEGTTVTFTLPSQSSQVIQ